MAIPRFVMPPKLKFFTEQVRGGPVASDGGNVDDMAEALEKCNLTSPAKAIINVAGDLNMQQNNNYDRTQAGRSHPSHAAAEEDYVQASSHWEARGVDTKSLETEYTSPSVRERGSTARAEALIW
eukprot:gb/GEZN01010548.1/.p1 GENE.gb/GEZN01010548.1/~~gb/GEZN01010548.1/.p1  ORF type:complete len:125 (-),score=21.45 gb/GEZN01010548.1/:347-721(-)